MKKEEVDKWQEVKEEEEVTECDIKKVSKWRKWKDAKSVIMDTAESVTLTLTFEVIKPFFRLLSCRD